MKVRVYLKHLVIPVIVITITLVTIFSSTITPEQNSRFSVAFLYSNNSVSVESVEQLIWNGLKTVQEDYEENYVIDDQAVNSDKPLFSIDYARSTSSGDALAKLNLYVNSSDIIIIYGNEYNDNLQTTITNYPTKTFLLLYNELQFVGENVSNIEIDLQQIYTDSFTELRSNTSTNKLLYISDLKEEDNQNFKDYYVDDSYDIEYMYVSDVDNYAQISNDLRTFLDQGIDQIFIDDVRYTSYIIEDVNDYQQSNVSKQIELNTLNEKLNEANTNLESAENEEELTQEITDLRNQISEIKVLQTNINTYNVGYDYTNIGLYDDVDGNQKSVVKYSYVIDTSPIFTNIFDIILNGEKIQKNYQFSYDDIVTKTEGVLNE